MTVDREALRRELAEALDDHLRDWGDDATPIGYADALLPIVERAIAAGQADLHQRVTALADDLDRQFREAGNDEPRGSVMHGYATSTGIGYRRAALRLRDVLAGYEGSLYYGALPWLRTRTASLTETEGEHG